MALAFAVLLLAGAWAFALLHRRGSVASAREGESAPATVTLDRVELHSEPSRDSAAEATLPQGARVRVTGERGDWVSVETDAGAKGFLPAEAVERDADRDARLRRGKTLLAFAPVYGVVGEDADISLAPYPLAPRGGRLTRGTVIPIHSVDHSYFAFRDERLGLAFVDSAQVDLVPRDPRQPAIKPEKARPLKNLTIVDLNGEPPPEEEPMADAEPAVSASEPVASAPSLRPGAIEPPAIRTRVDPAYPENARRAGIEGTVELEVAIDASGKVTDVEVVRGLPFGVSDAAADAVRRWTYRPARGPNGPIASRKTVRIRFALESAEP